MFDNKKYLIGYFSMDLIFALRFKNEIVVDFNPKNLALFCL